MDDILEWKRVLLDDLPAAFLVEVVVRSAIMFIVILVGLRFTGKRGVRQLSVFEIVLIIALGSAAGDPMFYEDVGLLPAICVFVIVIAFYRLVTWFTSKSKKFEELLEGRVHLLIENGVFAIDKFDKEDIAQDEFFSELRVRSVEHLGQVKYAFLEPSGNISIFFFKDADVRPGLPLLPMLFNKRGKHIEEGGLYSCSNCGHTQTLFPGIAVCPVCKKEEWVQSLASIRTA